MNLDFPPWAVLKPKRKEHVRRVAALLDRWADRMAIDGGERDRWLKAAILHDALRDASKSSLKELSDEPDWPVSLWHGPAAAVRAQRDGENDPGVLSAVKYHSVGHHSWDRVGRMLYLADYLEPGRRFKPKRRAKLADQVPADPGQVLRKVVQDRLAWNVRSGLPLRPESVEFWNCLLRESDS